MRLIIFATLLFVMLISGCKTSTSYTYTPPVMQPSGKILFASFRVKHDSTGTNIITLLKTSGNEGKLKEQQEPILTSRLDVHLVDASGKILVSTAVPHPLLREAEYKKDGGTFERKTISVTEAEFFVRMIAPPSATRFLIDEIQDDKKVNTTSISIP